MWKIAVQHHPLYCSRNSDKCVVESGFVRPLVEDIFHANKLDLVMAGHSHLYERGYPTYNYTVDTTSVSADGNTYLNPKYPAHVICGAGGNSLGTSNGKPKPFAKVIFGDMYGTCNVDITSDSVTINFVRTDNSSLPTLDSWKIVKSTNKPN